MTEEWVPIADFEDYSVSNMGQVKRVTPKRNKHKSNSKPLVQMLRGGYLFVNLYKDGMHMGVVHQIVAKSFFIKKDSKDVVNHKNGIKTDNRLENLEYCSHSENTKHAIRLGLVNVPDNRGERSGHAKLTESDIKLIRQEYSEGIMNQRELGVKFKVRQQQICRIINKKRWAHV